jgi:hypothetical protein
MVFLTVDLSGDCCLKANCSLISINKMAVKNFMVYIKTNFGVDAQKLVRMKFAFKQQSP